MPAYSRLSIIIYGRMEIGRDFMRDTGPDCRNERFKQPILVFTRWSRALRAPMFMAKIAALSYPVLSLFYNAKVEQTEVCSTFAGG